MRKKAKIPIKIALIIVCFVAAVWAEVKLRIYLQDGTLQAGNLVTENPDSFVILTKEGRAEIKKEKIMFINGKTLKQWQERPDKLFQTEIIPSEIPDPAYVNDKAAAPEPIKVKPIKSAAVESQSPAVLPPPVSAPVVPVKPVDEPKQEAPVIAKENPKPVAKEPVPTEIVKPQSVVATPKTLSAQSAASGPSAPAAASTNIAPNPTIAPIVPPVRVRKKSKPIPPPETKSPEVVAKATPPLKKIEPVNQSAVDSITPPTRFVRKDFGDYHYQRAIAYMKAGHRGQAIQELHVATILDRQNGDSIFLLGKLYAEDGLSSRAAKYFSHPLVKKRDDAKKITDDLNVQIKNQKRQQWILYGATSVGLFAWVPFLVGLRKLRKPPKRVLTAETTKETVSPLIEELANVVERKIETVESPVPPVPVEPVVKNTVAMAPQPAPALPPAPKEINAPPQPIEIKPRQPLMPPIIPPKISIEVPLPPPQLEIASVSLPPEPSPAPPPHANGLDTESVLRLAALVEKAVRQGNALAFENQLDRARREYRTALALNPSCLEAYSGLGYLSFAQGQFDLALEFYTKALQIDANSSDAHYGLGRVYLETDRIDEAITEFQKTLALDPAFDDARDTLTALEAAA